MLKAKLVVVGGDAKSTEVNLRLPCLIGRGREATLTLPHPLVSRRHCEILEQDGKLIVKDLGSLNGTFVNNKKIEKCEPLDPNELLTLGNVTFRAVYEIGQQLSADASAPTEATVKTEKAVAEANARELVETDPAADENAPTVADDSKKSAATSNKETVYENESANDTDQSLPSLDEFLPENEADDLNADDEKLSSGIGSKIVVDDPDFASTADRSVSLSSLDSLPPGPKSATSFADEVELGDEKKAKSVVESKIQIDLGTEHKKPAESGSGLDSFINKLPR